MGESNGEEPPLKRRRYERSSTPIRELLDPPQPPELPALSEEEEGRENGLISVEESIASDTEQEDTVCPGDDEANDQDPDYFGLSNEAMGIKLVSKPDRSSHSVYPEKTKTKNTAGGAVWFLD